MEGKEKRKGNKCVYCLHEYDAIERTLFEDVEIC